MEQAKEDISGFVKSIPEDANVSLIAYGHVGSSADSDKAKSCSSVETIQYVHLSVDEDTAYKVGKREGEKFFLL